MFKRYVFKIIIKVVNFNLDYSTVYTSCNADLTPKHFCLKSGIVKLPILKFNILLLFSN